ncbi:unnamed protein product [Trichobilharzia regenti]|nr:unnamed protein product [Trichobilharzia regenti]
MSAGPLKSQHWLHHNSQLAPDAGVTYELRYVGSIPVLTSIKSVDLNTRTRICRYIVIYRYNMTVRFFDSSDDSASIRRVCEDVGLKLPNSRLVDKSIRHFIGPSTDMTWAMANVYLTITSQTLTVETLENGVDISGIDCEHMVTWYLCEGKTEVHLPSVVSRYIPR